MKMRCVRRALLISALAGVLAACDTPLEPHVCTAIAVDAINVTVTDAASGQRICDATVTASDGGFREQLRVLGGPADCVYSGPTERAGRYEVQVSRPGYATASASGVRVDADECHVIPVRVAVPLSRG
jgi:hypothetical protein